MRSPRLALVSLALLPVLAACGGAETGDAGDPGGEGGGRRFVSIGTAPAGGAFFVVGGALAEVTDRHVDGWQVVAEATKGSQENIRRLV